MVQCIINNMPDEALVFDPASFKLKICLESNAMALLLQTHKGKFCGIEYYSWTENDNRDVAMAIDSLQKQSRLFKYNILPTTIYYRTENMMLAPTQFTADTKQLLNAQFGFRDNETTLQKNITNDILAARKTDINWK